MNLEEYTQMTYSKASRKRRAIAFLIDHMVMTLLIVLIVFAVVGANFSVEETPFIIVIKVFLAIIIGFSLYIAKDSIKGISIGKWIMGIMVRDENNQSEVPSFKRLFLRNLLIIIFPVEIIILLTNQENKRLGDQIAKTVVLLNPEKPKKLKRVITAIGIAIILLISMVFISNNSLKSSDAYKTAIVEIQHNKDIIKETGGIKGYGMMTNGGYSISNGKGNAGFVIKVLGKTKDVDVVVVLTKEKNEQWKLDKIQK